ncbi:calponin homology domain-containing protein DDB_G0272472-like [Vespa crabro]|uniref:calponin homology domain-containing protein DDB_G0272472-like n=1 Tax=Vespa crabro TaxID=7445 RepID=UPI001F0322C9|nr:calponin homology domain-containing protein DDB_G0272472-like [Vespa crabro]
MDNYCAPQWVDFTSSPQVPSDDYFDKYHDIYESKLCTKEYQSTKSTKKISEIIETPKKSVQSQNRYFIKSMSTENLQTEIDSLKNTPIKVIYPSPYNNSKQKVIKQVSYENILNEAMQNVQLCEDLCNDKKDIDVSSTENIFKKPIPIKSKTSFKPVKIREIENNSALVSTNKQMQDIERNILKEETKNESLFSNDMFKPDTSSSIKVMKDFSKTSKIDDHLKCNIQQNNDLKNDRSKIKLNNKNFKLKSSGLKQQSSMKQKCSTTKINTHNRPVVTLSHKDQEKSKLIQVEKNQSKTKFVRNNSADSSTSHNKITQKNVRVANADTTVKQTHKPYSSFSKEGKLFCQKNNASKRMVTTIVGNTGSEIIIKKEKILFFDIPIHTKQKKITCPVPFSFEHRDKIKKQLKLDQSESKCIKSKSVPNLKLLDINMPQKVPSKLFDTGKKALMSSCSSKEINDKNKNNKQFEGSKKSSTAYIHSLPSHKLVKTVDPMKNKIEKKKIQDSKNKKDAIQAKKSLVSVSCKNIQINTNLKIKKQEILEVNKKCIEKENRQPNINMSVTNNSTLNQSKGIKLKSTVFKTNVEEREKQRRVLEDKMKQKKILQEEKIKKEKEEKEANEKLEIAKLRKQTEIRARPMPVYKPLIRVKSTKPLTKPQSPAWSSKRRVKSTL